MVDLAKNTTARYKSDIIMMEGGASDLPLVDTIADGVVRNDLYSLYQWFQVANEYPDVTYK